MATGLQVLGDGMFTQIDDTLGINLKYVTKFTYNRQGNYNYTGNRINVTVPAGINASDLILAIRPEANMNQAFRAVVSPNKPNNTTVSIQVMHPLTHNSRDMNDIFYRVNFTGYLFIKSDSVPTTSKSGLEVYNAQGQLAFSSANKQVKVLRFVQTSNRPRGSYGDGWWTWRCQTGITNKTNRAYLMNGGRNFQVPYGRYEGDQASGTEGLGWNNNQLFVDFFSYNYVTSVGAPYTYLPNSGSFAGLHPSLMEFDVTGL